MNFVDAISDLQAMERARYKALPWYKKLWESRANIGCMFVCLFICLVFWYGLYKGWQTFGPKFAIVHVK